MIRPLENHERINTGEYANRVRKPEGTHSSTSRDFGYEMDIVERDGKKRHDPDAEFGEDTYESAAENASPPDPELPEPGDEGKLDISV